MCDISALLNMEYSKIDKNETQWISQGCNTGNVGQKGIWFTVILKTLGIYSLREMGRLMRD